MAFAFQDQQTAICDSDFCFDLFNDIIHPFTQALKPPRRIADCE
jgi:hypothetical protein